jgi:hypothetical protein
MNIFAGSFVTLIEIALRFMGRRKVPQIPPYLQQIRTPGHISYWRYLPFSG